MEVDEDGRSAEEVEGRTSARTAMGAVQEEEEEEEDDDRKDVVGGRKRQTETGRAGPRSGEKEAGPILTARAFL